MRNLTRRAAVAGLTGIGANAAWPAFSQEDPASAFTALLARYVSSPADGINRVAYGRWRANSADRASLDRVVNGFSALAPSRMQRLEAFAFWANLYNAITLKVVVDRYPVRSIREIRSDGVLFDPQAFAGPWRAKRVTIEGRRMSLDDIEHGTLRPLVRDPRVHYAVNCASLGCPNLQPRAWRAATLEQDLDAAARAFVNHARGAHIDARGALQVSSIYQWFKEDFGGGDAGVIAHLRHYAEPVLSARLASISRIGADAYDWRLNEAP